jgi:outer membrane protein OmpA-like peptidoglycan-associated protein
MCSKGIGGNWSKPVKCTFNTEFDEDAPFIHPDGKTLYFSSKGNGSMGGYDVFKVSRLAPTGNVWSKPINMGAPINTALDDVYFSLSADGKVGLYASDQEGGFGKQDIYSIRFPIVNNTPELTLLKGVVQDATTGKNIEAQITVTDNTTKEIVATHHSNSATGAFLIALPSGKNYGIAIEKEGKLFYSENIQLNNGEGFRELNQKVVLQSAKQGSQMTLNNIFFESASDVLSTDSYLELNKLYKILIDNPTLKIEIAGHTDNVGKEQDNQLLSERRALAVKNFMIQKGIAANRMVSKGYGSSKPIATNQTEDGRKRNRRTEITIL